MLNLHKKLEIETPISPGNVLIIASVMNKTLAFLPDKIDKNYVISEQCLQPVPPDIAASDYIIREIAIINEDIVPVIDLAKALKT